MKKVLLSIFAVSSLTSAIAQCSDIFISEYVEGSNNNKAIELYNPTNHPIALNNNYKMVRYNNGTGEAAGNSNAQATINLGTHVFAPYSTWVIVIDRRDTTQTSGTNIVVAPGLRALADTFLCYDYAVSYTMNFNGNDALSLQKSNDGGATWSYLDIFGKMGDASMVSGYGWSDQFPYDGSAGAIWTENHTLIRKASVTGGVTSNPSTFIVTTEYDSLPEDTWTNLHIHNCVCTTGINEMDNSVAVSVYPNPSNAYYSTVSANEPIEMIEVYNVVGEKVMAKTSNNISEKMTIESGKLSKGVYFVKAYFEKNKVKTIKLTVQ